MFEMRQSSYVASPVMTQEDPSEKGGYRVLCEFFCLKWKYLCGIDLRPLEKGVCNEAKKPNRCLSGCRHRL